MSVSKLAPIFFQGPYLRQNFSLPDSVIYYMAMNPSSAHVYQKLIQTCKYFFAKNPIIVLQCLHFIDDEWIICVGECKITKSNGRKFDIEKISRKFWITHVLNTGVDGQIAPPSIISKLYRCDIKHCLLHQQSITFDQLLFLASSADVLILEKCVVTDNSGSHVQIENIVAAFPTILKFASNQDALNTSINTVKNLFKIPHFSTLSRFFMFQISDLFDIETVYEYLKTCENGIHFCFIFSDSISDAYLARLETIVDDILETSSSYNYKFPYIFIPSLNIDKQEALFERYYENLSLP
uniref:Uncharacterized protein n=1 Tax=Panagrolaimus sp. ES5 TaxID=591445 RepID=A0AC34GRK8_9BILA